MISLAIKCYQRYMTRVSFVSRVMTYVNWCLLQGECWTGA